jgi:hypothetical protein
MPVAIELSKTSSVERLPRGWREELEFMRRVSSRYSVYRSGTWCYLIDVQRNVIAVECPLSERKRLGMRVYHPEYTRTNMRYRGQGLALQLYRALVLEGVTLVSGDSQSEGSRKLWGKLAAARGVAVWARRGNTWSHCELDTVTGYADCDWDVYELSGTTLYAHAA